MKFEDMNLGIFLDELASDAPAPGGGSTAALCGALSAALVSMVGRLTVGKEKYKENWDRMEAALKKSERLRAEFIKLANEDTESFNVFMAALKMPRETKEEKEARKTAMADAAKRATEIPLRTLEACEETAKLACDATEFGNKNAASDGGSAALLAEAAAKAASYNVRINLPGVKDEAFARECRERTERALRETEKYAAKAAELIDGVLS